MTMIVRIPSPAVNILTQSVLNVPATRAAAAAASIATRVATMTVICCRVPV